MRACATWASWLEESPTRAGLAFTPVVVPHGSWNEPGGIPSCRWPSGVGAVAVAASVASQGATGRSKRRSPPSTRNTGSASNASSRHGSPVGAPSWPVSRRCRPARTPLGEGGPRAAATAAWCAQPRRPRACAAQCRRRRHGARCRSGLCAPRPCPGSASRRPVVCWHRGYRRASLQSARLIATCVAVRSTPNVAWYSLSTMPGLQVEISACLRWRRAASSQTVQWPPPRARLPSRMPSADPQSRVRLPAGTPAGRARP